MTVDLWINAMPRRTFMAPGGGDEDGPASRVGVILDAMDAASIEVGVLMTRLPE